MENQLAVSVENESIVVEVNENWKICCRTKVCWIEFLLVLLTEPLQSVTKELALVKCVFTKQHKLGFWRHCQRLQQTGFFLLFRWKSRRKGSKTTTLAIGNWDFAVCLLKSIRKLSRFHPVIWLILPELIRFSQRFSHACISWMWKSETANGSLQQV